LVSDYAHQKDHDGSVLLSVVAQSLL
jgi:hypothetical protein